MTAMFSDDTDVLETDEDQQTECLSQVNFNEHLTTSPTKSNVGKSKVTVTNRYM